MISTVYFKACSTEQPTEIRFSGSCKTSLIVLQLLLVGSGAGLCFTGTGVLRASLLFDAALLIDMAVFADHYCAKRKNSAAPSSTTKLQQISNEFLLKFSEKSQELIHNESCKNFFTSLVLNNVLKLSSSAERGLSVIPGCFFSHCSMNPPPLDQDGRPRPLGDIKVMPDEDYYNASYITSCICLAASPKSEKSIETFWKMVQTTSSYLIIMTTDLKEPIGNFTTKEVCATYWPESHNQDMTEGQLLIRFKETFKDGPIQERSFSIRENNTTSEVIQYHFKNWMPNEAYDASTIYKITRICLKTLQTFPERSILVHDEDGTDQAAVFTICLLLHTIHEIAKAANLQAEIDLQKLVTTLRSDPRYGRYEIIKTAAQYKTILSFAEFLKTT